jgi:FAD/FMN-containing dehydrogenase
MVAQRIIAMTDMLQIQDTAAPVADAPEVLVFPGDERWDEARMAWNLTVDQHPAAVALPRSARDVCDVVRWARTKGYRVAAQGTGHNAMPLATDESVVLVKTHLMRKVTIDAEHLVARVQAGAQWGDVVPAAAEHGLAALSGSSHDVGVVGTRSAAASPSSPAATDWRPTACSRSSSSTPTAT